MSGLKLNVDNREARLYEYLLDMLPEVDIEVKPLDIGDVEIEHHNPDFRLIFERKTEKDLASSIKDGRYREQKLRMLHTAVAHHCTYIIENHDHWSSRTCSPSVYAGAIINTMYRDGMHVVVVQGTKQTAEWIAHVVEKCQENPDRFVAPSAAECDYLSVLRVKTKKQENIDVTTCFQLQLCQIPGISQKLAFAITELYPSWRHLYRAMDNCVSFEEKVRTLCKIPLIGEKKARCILEYIQET